MALFKSVARRFRRGISDLRCALDESSSPIAFNACDRSMMRFIREINTEINAATAPRRNAGGVTWPMTCDSWVMDGVSESMGVLPRFRAHRILCYDGDMNRRNSRVVHPVPPQEYLPGHRSLEQGPRRPHPRRNRRPPAQGA